MSRCLVVMSGGQDSTTCLFKALKEYDHVEAVSFNYKQKHAVELEKAKSICDNVPVKLTEVDISFLNFMGNSSLTGNGGSVLVCNRNALFLTIAHGMAQNIGADEVLAGMCQGDFSGFTDCRESFIKSLEDTLNMGYDSNVRFVTPLMHKTKAETFELADELGILDIILHSTHTCYEGVDDRSNDWGKGCGVCASCDVRRKGWESFIQQKLMVTK